VQPVALSAPNSAGRFKKLLQNEYLQVMGLLGILLLILFAPALFGGRIFAPFDLLQNFYPWRSIAQGWSPPWNPLLGDRIDWTYPNLFIARESLLRGQLPLWNPFTSGGQPSGTLPMYGLLFPLNLVYLILPLDSALCYHAMLRLLLAGIGMYAFMREIEVSRWGARLAAVAFMLNGFHIVWLGVQTTYTSVWIPWLLWATERFIRRRDILYVCLLAVLVALMISGGFIAVAAYGLYAWGLYVLLRLGLGIAHKGFRRARFADGVALVGGLVAGFLLIAAQLLPLVEFLGLTSYDQQRVGRGALHLPLWQSVNYLMPDYYGNHVTHNWWGAGNYLEAAGYVGILTLILAGVALLIRWRERNVLFFLLLGVVSFSLVYGFPPRQLFSWMPMINSSSPSRLLIINAFVLAGLAGFGADAVLAQCVERSSAAGLRPRRKPRDMRRVGRALSVVALSLLVPLFGTELYWFTNENTSSHTLLQIITEGRWDSYQIGTALLFGFLFLAGLTLCLLAVKGWLSRWWAGLAMVELLALDLLLFALPFNPMVPADYVRPETPGIEFLRREQEPFRIMGVGFFTFYPNLPGVFGIEDIRGHNPLRTDRVARLWQAIDPRVIDRDHHGTFSLYRVDSVDWASPIIDLLNVRYVLFDPGDAPPATAPAGRFELVYDGDDMRIFQNNSYLDRVWWVARAEVPTDPEQLLQRVQSSDWQPREVVFLESPAAPAPRGGSVQGEGQDVVSVRVSLRERSANHLLVSVSAPTDGFLVFSELFYPGWQARLVENDQALDVLPADFALRAVAVPAGTWQIEMAFRPLLFRLGLYLGGLTASAIVLMLGWRWVRRRRERDRV
jgi:hypothetical protein